MATYATDLQVMNAADSSTGWAELSGHTSGAAPAATTETYIQNGIAIDQATGQATGQNAGMQYDSGANISWTSGWVFTAWQFFASPTNINTWANGGMRIGIGSTSGNMRYWNAVGNDFGAYPYGGWQNTAIDPQVAGDQTDGSPVAGNYRLFGSMPNMLNKITKGSPHAVDIIRYGRGQFQVTGADATFAGMAAANDADTARWGLFQVSGGGYLWKGLMSLGLAGTSVTFSDSNKSIRLDDTPRTAAAFNKIEIRNASSSVTWNSISVSGVQTSITGSAPVSPGDFEVVDNPTVVLNGCTFTDLGTFVFQSNTDVIDCTFRRCKQLTQGGAEFTGNLVTNGEDAISLVVSDLSLVTGNTFVSDGSNHAVDLGTIGSTTSVTWDNVATSYATGATGSPITPTSTGNEIITANVPSGVTLTINVAAGATVPSVRNTAGTPGTINVVAGLVTLTLTGLVADSEVRIYSAGTTTELDGVENSGTSFAFTYTYAASTFVDIVVHKADYKYIRIEDYLLGSGDSSLPIQQIFDRNYSNP
jgi:hypothetical protein